MPRKNPFPTAGTVDHLNKSVRATHKEFAEYEHLIAVPDRRRMANPRTGGDKMVSLILDVATRYGLDLPNSPIASIRDAQAAGENLRPLSASVAALLKSVSDTAFTAESAAWSGAMTYYSVLSRIAENDEHLRVALQPIADFFARRSSTVRQEQIVTRAQRKAEKAEKKAAEAKRAAEAVKARRGDAETPTPVA